MTHSPEKRLAFSAVTAGIALLGCLTVSECLLRVYERRTRQQPSAPMEVLNIFQANPAGTGSYRLRPHLDIKTRVQGRQIRIVTNSHGMRWRETPIEKPKERKRIAFVGDSFTFGCWADSIEDTFVGVFDAGLGHRFEALNFGVGGYGVDDIELQVKEQVVHFSPDYVFLMFFNGNDFRDTYLGTRKYKVVGGTAELDSGHLMEAIPESLLRNDFVVSKPAPDTSFWTRNLRRLATYRVVSRALGMQSLSLSFRPSSRFTAYSFWSRFPYPPLALRAKDETLATIGRIHDFLGVEGSRLVIVTIPYREQVYSAEESGRDFDIDLPQAYVRIFAREHNIPYLDLLPKLRGHVQRTNQELYVRDDLHFNNRGHLLVGQILEEWFATSVRPSGNPQHAELAFHGLGPVERLGLADGHMLDFDLPWASLEKGILR